MAAGIGLVTGAGSVGFMWLLHAAGEIFLRWPPLSDHLHATHPWWLIAIAPAVGALFCGLIVHFVTPEARGHGVPEVMLALYRKKGVIRPRVALFKALASAFTIGSGGTAGAEGPIVQIGSAIGSTAGKMFRVGHEFRGTLVGCGAAAGIASVFNAPVAGIFFVLEILLRDFSVRTFTPIVIASVFSSAMTRAIPGHNQAIFAVSGELAGYEFTMAELPYYLVLGLLCGLIAVSFTKSLDMTEGFYARLKIHGVLKPVTGALVLGIVSLPVMWYAADYLSIQEAIPPYYGNGYPWIRRLLTFDFYEQFGSANVLFFAVLTLGFLKLAGTCLTLGSGGSGGIFAPSLFLGAAAGGIFGVVVTTFDPIGFGVESPAAYALVGMAAVVAGATHAPLTAILILFEITGDYKVILPVMLATALSTIVAQLIMSDNIYTIKVRRAGVRVGYLSDLTILRRLTVSHVPLSQPVFVRPDQPASRLIRLAETHNAEDFVIVNDDERYLGMVTSEDLRFTLLGIEALPLLVVDELKRTDIPTTYPDETLDVVMDKFSRTDSASIPVLSDDGESSRVLGMISRSRMMRQYHLTLDQP